MKPIEVQIRPKRITMAAPAEDGQKQGLELVRDICNSYLRAISTAQKAHPQMVDPEMIAAVKNVSTTLVDVEKAERERRREEKQGNDPTAGMSEEELRKVAGL